jgi:hypothetical protein
MTGPLDLPTLDAVFARACGAGVALILLLAALDKLRDLDLFAAVIEQYRLVPRTTVHGMALVVPLAEILAAVLLLWPAARAAGALLACVLLLTFAGAIAVNLLRGRYDIDCGCGGLGSVQTISWWLVLRNGVLALLALAGAAEGAARSFTWVDLCTALGATLALLALYAAFTQLSANAPRLHTLRRGGRQAS